MASYIVVVIIVLLFSSHKSLIIGKQRALNLEVTCNYRLNLKMGQTSVKPSWKHRLFTSNYHCLHTGVPYKTAYGWNRPNVKAQCSLFTYTNCIHFLLFFDM